MHQRRFRLPPLSLIQGFEAAARTLSFTGAAAELSLTQSAISRQIKALEEHLGVALFERRHRALALTPAGRSLHKAVGEVLERLAETTAGLGAGSDQPYLTVTTTGGFASLWLIPRLKRFTALHPDVDVRISATHRLVNLERSLVDIAVRYAREEDAPAGAVRLFGEELTPVCSPALTREGPHPLTTLADLRHHAALHIDGAGGYLDWETWLAAQGHADVKPGASLRFDGYERMIQAAVSAQGVALGIERLVRGLIEEGRLVQPFSKSLVGARAYFLIASALTAGRPHVRAFAEWVMAEARGSGAVEAARLSSRAPAGP